MKLTPFIEGLLQNGSVEVEDSIHPFREADGNQALLLLKQYYDRDVVEMSLIAPGFDPGAALWAAQYLYRAVQFILLRDQNEETIALHLQAFTEEQSAEAVYSVDLVFRYLPDLFKLAKGLAPGDPLVNHLKQEGARWPFSSVGIEIPQDTNDAVILSHASLRYEYADRIIRLQDRARLNKPELAELAKEALGEHASAFWPGIELIFQNIIV